MVSTKRRRRRRAFALGACAFVVAAFALAAAAGLAAQTARIEPVRLGDLYTQVQRANPKAAAARSLAAAAQARVPGATRPPDPVLQFGFMNYMLPGLSPMSTIGMPQLQVMQMLPLGGKLTLAGRAASASASAANLRTLDVLWDLRSETAMAFYDLYATDQSLAVSRETLRLLADIERTAEAMYRVGQGHQTDVLRAQVEIAKMTEDTLRMHAMRETMVARLNALLDRDGEAALGAPLPPTFPDSVPSPGWLDSIAAANRPTIRAGLDEVRAADASERLARKAIWPDLAVGMQYAQRGGEMGGGTERMGSLMLGASLPIFARDRQLKMRDEAGAMKQMALADVASMRAETRGEIGAAYANLRRARTLAQLYRTTVLPQAEATVASALAAYQVGNVDFMTLLDDRMTVNKYQQELYALEADEGKAWANLEMLTGRELFDPNNVAARVAATRGGK